MSPIPSTVLKILSYIALNPATYLPSAERLHKRHKKPVDIFEQIDHAEYFKVEDVSEVNEFAAPILRKTEETVERLRQAQLKAIIADLAGHRLIKLAEVQERVSPAYFSALRILEKGLAENYTSALVLDRFESELENKMKSYSGGEV